MKGEIKPRGKSGNPDLQKHDNHPVTDVQKAEFADKWSDIEKWTLSQMGQYYAASVQTLARWAASLGHPNRTESARRRKLRDGIALEVQVLGTPQGSPLAPPMEDEEIASEVKGVISELRAVTAHSDLLSLRRKAMRTSGLFMAKAPITLWVQGASVFDQIARSALNMSRVESLLPEGKVDEVALRKQAAAALFREMKAVLSPEEQVVLSKIVSMASSRLKARGGSHESITAGVEDDPAEKP